MKTISFPLRVGSVSEWSDLYPARHGRVSFGQFAEQRKLSSPMIRVITALHYEFSEFHRRISQPLEHHESAEESLAALMEYALGVVERIETGMKICYDNHEDDYSALSRSALLIELVHITLVEQPIFASCRLPRWLIRHCGFPVEPLVLSAESSLDNPSIFWHSIKVLSIMDLTPVVAKLLARYLEEVPCAASGSIQLLLAFFEEVPSLFDIGASARSVEEGMHAIEKRRQMASVAFFRDKKVSEPSPKDEASKAINFIWRLVINAEEDHQYLLEELLRVEGLEWYGKTALVWTWLHPANEPSVDLMTALGEAVAPTVGADALSASLMDALIFAGLAGDTLSLLSLLIPEQEAFGGKPLLALLIDIVFYAGGLPQDLDAKIRDTVLMDYCHWLASSGAIPRSLGLRLAADVVLTLSPEASARGQQEIVGKLAKLGTSEWYTSIKLIESSPSSLPESISLERFHSHVERGEFLSAIHALAVAAELSADVHIGACRISDFVDQYGKEILEALKQANEASRNHVSEKSILLPEYIESGRFQFFSQYVLAEKNASALVKLAVSPNCPPELLVALISEIKQTCQTSRLSPEEAIALCKVLIDSEDFLSSINMQAACETLLSWLATESFVRAD